MLRTNEDPDDQLRILWEHATRPRDQEDDVPLLPLGLGMPIPDTDESTLDELRAAQREFDELREAIRSRRAKWHGR